MAEAVAVSFVSKAIAPPSAFMKAYEAACSIWGAKNELDAITDTIRVIEAALQEAEKRQDQGPGGERVKFFMERNKQVVYKAEDLFDEVATNDLLKKHMDGIWKKYLKAVRLFFSKQNQLVSNYSIVQKVASIRQKLERIKADMDQSNFVPRIDYSIPIAKESGSGSFVDPKYVFGRDDDKKAILDFLCDEDYADKNISLISIVGIGGMGKTSLAQLVYNDAVISSRFEDRRWWACISRTANEREVVEKIYHAITGKEGRGLSIDWLQNEISRKVGNQEKFFLVLDDLWEENKDKGEKLLSLLRRDSGKGSKIMITARYSTVAKAMNADKTHELGGLSDDASWELFEMSAFTEQQRNDPNWEIIGKKIMAKCANVPLAIRSIACALNHKNTLTEWEQFEDEELSKIEGSISIMSALKLSYYYLPPHLKPCFAYCSLFEKDSILYKKNLINLWIAQGYVIPTESGSLEGAGHSVFLDLLRRCFFCEVKEARNGEIESCKMHDLVHDLAQEVAGAGIVGLHPILIGFVWA